MTAGNGLSREEAAARAKEAREWGPFFPIFEFLIDHCHACPLLANTVTGLCVCVTTVVLTLFAFWVCVWVLYILGRLLWPLGILVGKALTVYGDTFPRPPQPKAGPTPAPTGFPSDIDWVYGNRSQLPSRFSFWGSLLACLLLQCCYVLRSDCI